MAQNDVEIEELRRLLQERSIRKGSFVLASGAESNYYCDTKATVLTPRGARLIGRHLYRLVRTFRPEAVGGLAIGATYLAAVVAAAADEARERDESAPAIPGFAVRPQAKDHGTESRIDAAWHPDGPLIAPGRRVAVVDDVVTTGGSTLQAIEAVEAAGCEVAGVAAVLDRRAGAAEAFARRGLSFSALFEADAGGDLHVA